MIDKARQSTSSTRREEWHAAGFLMSSKTILSLVLIGLFSFAALITLSGYAGDFRERDSSGPHALSRSAIGFGGIASLLDSLGYDVQMVRSQSVVDSNDAILRIYTLSQSDQGQINSLVTSSPTLLVLPKWRTVPIQGRQDWVRKARAGQSTFASSLHEVALETQIVDVSITQQAKTDPPVSYVVSSADERWSMARDVQVESLQTIDGDNLITLYSANALPVLVKIEDEPIYILSDPDFLNTMGLKNNVRARLGVDMLDAVIEDSQTRQQAVEFDLTLHGYGGSVNIIKVMTQPPFLAATLCLLAAGALIAWQAFSRFGNPVTNGPSRSQGKLSLVESASYFIGLARREPNMASDYVKIVRNQVIQSLSLQGRRPQDVDIILQTREQSLGHSMSYRDLQVRADQVADMSSLMELTVDLQRWKDAMITGQGNEHR